MSYLDKTFCASPGCQNKCGRKMTDEERKKLDDQPWKGIDHPNHWVSYGYFCEQEEQNIKDDEQNVS